MIMLIVADYWIIGARAGARGMQPPRVLMLVGYRIIKETGRGSTAYQGLIDPNCLVPAEEMIIFEDLWLHIRARAFDRDEFLLLKPSNTCLSLLRLADDVHRRNMRPNYRLGCRALSASLAERGSCRYGRLVSRSRISHKPFETM